MNDENEVTESTTANLADQATTITKCNKCGEVLSKCADGVNWECRTCGYQTLVYGKPKGRSEE